MSHVTKVNKQHKFAESLLENENLSSIFYHFCSKFINGSQLSNGSGGYGFVILIFPLLLVFHLSLDVTA